MAEQYLAFIGTYTQGDSEGIYSYRFDMASGRLDRLGAIGGIENPTFLALSPSGDRLYAVEAVTPGTVHAYSVDRRTGALSHLNQQSSEGDGPCHVSVDRTGQYVLVANYMSGSVAALPIDERGKLRPASGFVQHEGSSVDPDRQKEPHAHSIILDQANAFAFAADLGTDKLMIYKLDLASGKLVASDSPWARTPPGAGPRHFDFHPNGRFAYLINEMGSSVTAFHYDPARGMLNEIHTVPTLPHDFDGVSHCADVHVHPSGKFLYGSNRGHDSIAVFSIDHDTGKLTELGHESTQGETPRNFVIDPSGTYLLAANQDTHDIVTFRIDQESGMPEPTGQRAESPSPVCIKLLPCASE